MAGFGATKLRMARRGVCAAAAAAGLAAAALAGASAPAAAQDIKLGEDPLSVMLKWRPTAPPAPMPDFVRKTRPAEDELHYTPLTGAQPERPRTKTPAELAETMKKLDAAGAGARAQASRAFGRARAPRKPGRTARGK